MHGLGAYCKWRIAGLLGQDERKKKETYQEKINKEKNETINAGPV